MMHADNHAPTVKGVSLANGRRQLVPGNLEPLNPDQEGRRACLYLVWLVDPDRASEPNAVAYALDESVEGRGLCHPFGWFTDFADLYKLGRHDAPMTRNRFTTAGEDFKAMQEALLDAAERELATGTWFAFAWALFDGLGGGTPVGTAPYAVKTKGGE